MAMSLFDLSLLALSIVGIYLIFLIFDVVQCFVEVVTGFWRSNVVHHCFCYSVITSKVPTSSAKTHSNFKYVVVQIHNLHSTHLLEIRNVSFGNALLTFQSRMLDIDEYVDNFSL